MSPPAYIRELIAIDTQRRLKHTRIGRINAHCVQTHIGNERHRNRSATSVAS
jgi:hypothetical protein